MPTENKDVLSIVVASYLVEFFCQLHNSIKFTNIVRSIFQLIQELSSLQFRGEKQRSIKIYWDVQILSLKAATDTTVPVVRKDLVNVLQNDRNISVHDNPDEKYIKVFFHFFNIYLIVSFCFNSTISNKLIFCK